MTTTPSDLSELDPIPDDLVLATLEDGLYHSTPPGMKTPSENARSTGSRLGLSGFNWEYLWSRIQKYSTYPPSVFFGLHIVNTSIIPLVTQSIAASETYLLLTRPIYQAPALETLLLTLPISAHVISGIVLRSIRQSRLAKLYGAETREQRKVLDRAKLPSTQATTGYLFLPLLGAHVLVNRIVPWYVDGGSSSVGLGFVAHGIAKNRWIMGAGYAAFIGVGVWHIIGGWAWWSGWRVGGGQKKTRKGRVGRGILTEPDLVKSIQKRQKRKWIISCIQVAGTALWLAGGLGVIGSGDLGSGWEAKIWDTIYSQVPLLGPYL